MYNFAFKLNVALGNFHWDRDELGLLLILTHLLSVLKGTGTS